MALDDLARARPDVEVVVKLRAAPGEQQTHEEQLPFDALWTDLADAGLVTESHVRFATGPLSDQLVPGSALVTVSSTAVLEAVAAGLPVFSAGGFIVAGWLLMLAALPLATWLLGLRGRGNRHQPSGPLPRPRAA